MESPTPEMMTDRIRLRLILGKYQVLRVQKELGVLKACFDMPGSVRVTFEVPPTGDVREGDLLTLYTEILTKPAEGAA